MPKVFSLLEKDDSRKIKEDDERLLKLKKDNEELKKYIQEEKQRHKQDNKSSVLTNKPNPQDQRNEIELLKKQVAEFQNIKDNSANPEISKEIKNLESQKQQIQTKLNQK
jgi:hypothetical protein